MQSSLIMFAILAVLSTETKAASDRTAFDGTWSVTLNAHDYKDPNTGQVALAYVYHFSAEIKNDVLHGERGNRGKAGWLELRGNIGADRTSTLHANASYWAGEGQLPISGRWTGSCASWQAVCRWRSRPVQRATRNRQADWGRIGIFDFVKD
jgi:hypothetical protein